MSYTYKIQSKDLINDYIIKHWLVAYVSSEKEIEVEKQLKLKSGMISEYKLNNQLDANLNQKLARYFGLSLTYEEKYFSKLDSTINELFDAFMTGFYFDQKRHELKNIFNEMEAIDEIMNSPLEILYNYAFALCNPIIIENRFMQQIKDTKTAIHLNVNLYPFYPDDLKYVYLTLTIFNNLYLMHQKKLHWYIEEFHKLNVPLELEMSCLFSRSFKNQLENKIGYFILQEDCDKSSNLIDFAMEIYGFDKSKYHVYKALLCLMNDDENAFNKNIENYYLLLDSMYNPDDFVKLLINLKDGKLENVEQEVMKLRDTYEHHPEFRTLLEVFKEIFITENERKIE